MIGKGKGRRTRGSEIDILGLYEGARAGLLLGWLGGCRLPCLVSGFFYVFGIEDVTLSYTRPQMYMISCVKEVLSYIRFAYDLLIPIKARIDLPDQSSDGYLPTLYAFLFNSLFRYQWH